MNPHLTPADDMDDTGAHAMHLHRCTGPCNQGRSPCPHPQACLIEEDDDQSVSADAEVLPQLFLLAVLCVLLCWHVVAWMGTL